MSGMKTTKEICKFYMSNQQLMLQFKYIKECNSLVREVKIPLIFSIGKLICNNILKPLKQTYYKVVNR